MCSDESHQLAGAEFIPNAKEQLAYGQPVP
jgi:hypothetical protein